MVTWLLITLGEQACIASIQPYSDSSNDILTQCPTMSDNKRLVALTIGVAHDAGRN